MALVYIAGAAILWLRLSDLGIPAGSVVGYLPRDFLISVGLRSVIAPLIAIAVGIGVLVGFATSKPVVTSFHRVMRALRRTPPPETRLDEEEEEREDFYDVLSATYYAVIAASLASGAYGLYELANGNTDVAVLLFIGSVTLYAGHFIVSTMLERKQEWLIVVAVVVAAAAILPFAVLVSHLRWTPHAAVACTADGEVVSGIYIGETADRIYLGGTGEFRGQESEASYVVSVAKGQTTRLYLVEGPPFSIRSCGGADARG